jgi:hypothetical protein
LSFNYFDYLMSTKIEILTIFQNNYQVLLANQCQK